MLTSNVQARTVGEALLRLLGARGISHVFANAGTDFAPLIEGWARCEAIGATVPKPVTAPHENVAVNMALGHWMLSGRPQAVMVHVNVGTANAVCGLLNAASANAPILLMAGRTPITEAGTEGARNIHIHWTQEMFDQAGLVREAVKWDYELRTPSQLGTVIDRALAVATTDPKGPVYLTLPREVLASQIDFQPYEHASRLVAATAPGPDISAIAKLADLIAEATNPVVITTSAGFEEGAVATLSRFADRYAIPVVQHVPRCLSLPSDHPMHAGYDPTSALGQADLVLVLESPVPWIPERVRPRPGAKVLHIGVDPLQQRIPIRGFECDGAITSSAKAAIEALEQALGAPTASFERRIAERRERIALERTDRAKKLTAALSEARKRPTIQPAWITDCIEQACGPEAILLREAPQFSLPFLKRSQEKTYFSVGAAGGLGWGLGAAVGAKLAAPDRLVAAVVGDGSYMFGTPTAAHYAALEQNAPFLTVIIDNQRWNEVGAATRHLYPDGDAARNPAREPLTYFDKSLRLEKTVEVAGGLGLRVTDPSDLPNALTRAVREVTQDGRQAVLDVVCPDL